MCVHAGSKHLRLVRALKRLNECKSLVVVTMIQLINACRCCRKGVLKGPICKKLYNDCVSKSIFRYLCTLQGQ